VDGGGISVETTYYHLFTSCTVTGNRAGGNGGGIRLVYGGLSISESIVWGNCADGSGDLAYVSDQSPISFFCSDVDSSGIEGDGSVTYVADNIFEDPLFCDPVACTSAPTTAGDYSIIPTSPCQPWHSPCGLQIGAPGLGCSGLAITSVGDVGNDQGRQVRMQWNSARRDAEGSSTPITQYSLWRRVEQYFTQQPDPGKQGGERAIPPGLVAPAGDWDFLTTVPAFTQPSYGAVCPTLCDSTISNGMCWSVFKIVAHTDVPSVYFESAPDSGYSLDNLAPSVPDEVELSEPGLLCWRMVEDPDFDFYTVYATEDGVNPRLRAWPVGNTVDTSYSLPDTTVGRYVYVTATDYAGNESAASEVVHYGIGVGEHPVLPTTYGLMQNVPNPFNPTTVIRFDIPEAANVVLGVYDISGRLVRTLVDRELPRARHSVEWDGRDNRGTRVASGVYFYKIEAGGFTAAKKMVLLK
jgi:hypothetical protein